MLRKYDEVFNMDFPDNNTVHDYVMERSSVIIVGSGYYTVLYVTDICNGILVR